MPATERLQTREQILSAFESVSLGDQSPAALKATTVELIGVSLATTPHYTAWQEKGITKEVIFEERIQDFEERSPTFWEETKIVMDQFNLPERTRKAFLLSLFFYDNDSWWHPNEFSYSYEELSVPIIDVFMPSDFAGKLPENTPEKRRRFLFLLVNSLIQYSPAAYDESNNWSFSEKYRQELIEYERKSGVRLLTVFMETAGKAA